MQLNPVKQLFIISALFGVVFSCRPSNENAEIIGAVEKTDSCLSNPGHSYEVFIPGHAKSDNHLNLLIAIDPHGVGKTAIEHLKEAATEYTAVLVASNLIQNNDRNYINELDELIADVKNRYPVSDRIYLAGFSGGARMVLSYATNHNANGIVACGAFAGPEQLSAIKCPVMGLVGMDDFNFLESAQYILNPGKIPSNTHIELIKGSHEWPESAMLTKAIGWFMLSDVSNDRQQVVQFVKEQQARIDSLATSGDMLQAVCIGRNMASVSNFEKNGSFHSTIDELTKREAYNRQLSQLAKSLKFEIKLRQMYAQALLEKNETWWKKEISDLNEKMTSEPDDMKKMAYKRVNGFLGIICYSYSRQFAARQDIHHLEQVLMVYRLIAPDNTEMQRLTGVLELLKSQQ